MSSTEIVEEHARLTREAEALRKAADLLAEARRLIGQASTLDGLSRIALLTIESARRSTEQASCDLRRDEALAEYGAEMLGKCIARRVA